MAQIVNGPPLPPFVGNAQPQHPIPGPGSEALKMIAGSDRMTYLVSPGVYDCAILTVFLRSNLTGRAIGSHRGMSARGMAHYNKFNGPKTEAIKALFDSILRAYRATEAELEVCISHHTGARGNYAESLAQSVNQAAPDLITITKRSYGILQPGQRGLNPITVYLAPDGEIGATQP